jgi:hypothetical protein
VWVAGTGSLRDRPIGARQVKLAEAGEKTQRPVQFEITEAIRDSLAAWVARRELRSTSFLFPGRSGQSRLSPGNRTNGAAVLPNASCFERRRTRQNCVARASMRTRGIETIKWQAYFVFSDRHQPRRNAKTVTRDTFLKYLHLLAVMGIAISITTGSAHAAAPAIGGDTLLRWLQSKDERDGSLAVGYIGGVREVTFQKEHCAASEVKLPEVIGAVRRVLEGMPKAKTMPGSWTVIAALQAKWPCPVKNGEAAPPSQGGALNSLAKEKVAPPVSVSVPAATASPAAPIVSVAPTVPAAPVAAAPATAPASAESGPTRAETEAYIVETVRSCDPLVSNVSLRATQLQYTSNKMFNYAIDLTKSNASSTTSTIFFSCTSPGCIDLSHGGFPSSTHNQTTLNCSYTIAPRLVRALQHYQSLIGKQKPLF